MFNRSTSINNLTNRSFKQGVKLAQVIDEEAIVISRAIQIKVKTR